MSDESPFLEEPQSPPAHTPTLRPYEEIPVPESLKPVADAITVTPVEPKPSKKAIVAQVAGVVASAAVLAQVLLPSGLWDTLAHVVELIAKAVAGN